MKMDEQTHDMTGWYMVWFMHSLSWFLFAGDERRRDQVTWYFHTRCSREVQWREGQQPAPNVFFSVYQVIFLRSSKVIAPRYSICLYPMNPEFIYSQAWCRDWPWDIHRTCQGFATDRMIFRDDELSYALGGCCWWLWMFVGMGLKLPLVMPVTPWGKEGLDLSSSNCPTVECHSGSDKAPPGRSWP